MNIFLTTISLRSETGGGTAERTRRMARHLNAQGHRCTLATMEDGNLAGELRDAGMPVYVMPVVKLRFQVPLINPFILGRLVRDADAIHILGYWNLLSVATAFLARWFRRPFAFSAAGEFVGLEKPRPIAKAFHALLGRHMLRHAALLIAITQLERQQILDRFALSGDQVSVVPNGVEVGLLTEETTFKLPHNPCILFVGRLAEVKGPDLLLEAFVSIAHDHADIMLVMVGPDFGLEEYLRSIVAEKGLASRVIFTGHLSENDRNAAYRQALLLAVPSRNEAMSLVAVEAGATGTPVLLTDQCGFDEVENCGGGLVVPATVAGLETGLRNMLARRTDLAQDGIRLRAHVMQHYAWPVIIARFAADLEDLAAGQPRSSIKPNIGNTEAGARTNVL